MTTFFFLRGLCGYVWVNIFTLSPAKGLSAGIRTLGNGQSGQQSDGTVNMLAKFVLHSCCKTSLSSLEIVIKAFFTEKVISTLPLPSKTHPTSHPSCTSFSLVFLSPTLSSLTWLFPPRRCTLLSTTPTLHRLSGEA